MTENTENNEFSLEHFWREETLKNIEQAYANKRDLTSHHSSLSQFLEMRVPRLVSGDRVSELGVGDHSELLAFFTDDNLIFDLFDWSETALNRLREKVGERENVSFSQRDLTCRRLPEDSYQLLFDSHLLHTLPRITGLRSFALKNFQQALRPTGEIYLEHMVLPSSLTSFQVDDLYRYEDGDLWLSHFDKPDLPVRHIPSAAELENEFLEAGFELDFFRIENHLSVIPVPERNEVKEGDPVLARLVARKK